MDSLGDVAILLDSGTQFLRVLWEIFGSPVRRCFGADDREREREDETPGATPPLQPDQPAAVSVAATKASTDPIPIPITITIEVKVSLDSIGRRPLTMSESFNGVQHQHLYQGNNDQMVRLNQRFPKKPIFQCYLQVYEWYLKLPNQVLKLLKQSSFANFLKQSSFANSLKNPTPVSKHQFLEALVRRFSPETNTFHLPCAEMMVQAAEWAHLTGLSFRGKAVAPMDSMSREEIRELTGCDFRVKKGGISFNKMMTEFIDDRNATGGIDNVRAMQHFRCFCFCLVGGLLLPNSIVMRFSPGLLRFLKTPKMTHNYSWGSASYDVLVSSIRRFAEGNSIHGHTMSIYGFYPALEYWANTYRSEDHLNWSGTSDFSSISDVNSDISFM